MKAIRPYKQSLELIFRWPGRIIVGKAAGHRDFSQCRFKVPFDISLHIGFRDIVKRKFLEERRSRNATKCRLDTVFRPTQKKEFERNICNVVIIDFAIFF